MRAALKQRMHAQNYGVGSQRLSQGLLAHQDVMKRMADATKIGKDFYDDWVETMKQTWIIDGEWSAYHSQVARNKGWALSQVQGLWQVVTANVSLFETNDAAREHVLLAEATPDHAEHALACIAVNAIMVGSLRG